MLRERVPVIGYRNHHRIDVLVIEHATQILHVIGLERGDLGEHLLVVDPRVRQVAVDVAKRLDLDILELGEASLQRISLPANSDAGRHDTVVRTENTAAHAGGSMSRRTEELAAHDKTRRRHSEPRREVAT